jgi:hypothetical protein
MARVPRSASTDPERMYNWTSKAEAWDQSRTGCRVAGIATVAGWSRSPSA